MKTPILRPATEAVLFGFERIGMAIRIAWLPVVIVIGLYTVSFARLVGFGSLDPVDIFGGDPQQAIQSLASSPDFVAFCVWQGTLLSLLASLILSCVYVALTRASTLADYEPPKLPFYFALGGRELRYFIVRLLYALLIIFATLILAAAGAGVAAFAAAGFGAVEGEAKALIVAPTAAVGVWLFLVWLWVLVRFLPALPIAAVESHRLWRRLEDDQGQFLAPPAFWRDVSGDLGGCTVRIRTGAVRSGGDRPWSDRRSRLGIFRPRRSHWSRVARSDRRSGRDRARGVRRGRASSLSGADIRVSFRMRRGLSNLTGKAQRTSEYSRSASS